MASIRKYTLANGETRFRAEILIKKDGRIALRESRSFDRQKLAKDWASRREIEIQETSVYKRAEYLSIRDLVAKYLEYFPPTGKSKREDLTALMNRPEFSRLNINALTAKDIVKHIKERNRVCKPQTAHRDLVFLRSVVRSMQGVIDLDLDMEIFATASNVLRSERLIAPSAKRDRLPTKEEIWKLSRHFHGSRMFYVFWFALYSARRQSEICRLQWDDIRHESRTYLVRDLKNPGGKGVHKWAKMPLPAYKIVMRQPKESRFVFPMRPKTVSCNFYEACKLLGIEGLTFHDARHAATTHWFEKGLSIQQVQQITLHSSWQTLQRYANMKPENLDI